MADEGKSENPAASGLDFVVKDPPLKRLKQHLTSISTAFEPKVAVPAQELSPNSLKSQLQQDESLLIDVLKDSASHISVSPVSGNENDWL